MNIIKPIVTREEFDSVPGPKPSYADVDKVYNFLATVNLGDSPRFTATSVVIDDVKVRDYSALIVARFYIEGDLHIQDAAGNVVNISELVSNLRALL